MAGGTGILNAMKTEKTQKVASGQKKKILLISLASTFVVAFMGSALNPAIPVIGQEFEAEAVKVGWVVTAYMLTCTALPVPFGRLADLIDRKRILVMGLGLFAAASTGGAAAGCLGQLLFFRLVQGAGTAMIYSTSMSILVSSDGPEHRGRLLGYSTAATYLGLSAGPAIGGVLTFQLGWRWIFAVTAAGAAVAFFGALRILPARDVQGFQSSGKLQGTGKIFPSGFSCFLYVSWVMLFLLGVSVAPASTWGWAAVAVGLVLMVYYLCREWKERQPVLPVKMFWKRPVFGWAALASLINYGTNFVLNYLLSVYFQVGLGFSSQKAGLILVISPAVQAVLSPFIGKVSGGRQAGGGGSWARLVSSGRVSPGRLSAVGMLGTAVVAAGFGLLQEGGSVWMVYVGLALAGISCALFAAPNTTIVMGAAGKTHYSMASAVLSTMRSLGHTLSMAAASGASAAVLGAEKLNDASPQQILMVMKITFFLWSFLCILGFFMALLKKV